MLRNKRFAEFKRNAEAASHLARILDREIDQAGTSDGMQEEQITLRYFLARALGEFEVSEGVDVLLKAAETNRNQANSSCGTGRSKPLPYEHIVFTDWNRRRNSASQLYPALARLAADEDARIRSQTA